MRLIRFSLIFIFCLFCGCAAENQQLRSEISNLKKELHTLRSEVSVMKQGMQALPQRPFTILFGGDILIANGSAAIIQDKGKEYPFKRVRDFLQQFDFVFANLEMAITQRGNPYYNKAYLFRVSESVGESLLTMKLNGVSIANNHIMDYGPTGLIDTLSFLKKNSIAYAGAGLTEDEARKPLVFTFGPTKVHILAYSERHPESFYAEKEKPGTAKMDLEIIKKDIKKYKRLDNVVLVSLHWGVEHKHLPIRKQVKQAHEIIDAGADGIIGHHSHWPQSIEVYNNRPIIYSLGNFVNGYTNKIEKDNILVSFAYDKSRLQKVEIYSLAGKNRAIKYQPYVQSGREAYKNLKLISLLSKKFRTPMKIKKNKAVIEFK